MNGKKPYKSDRRTRYTRQVIKDTFLTMLQECSFEKVTVTALCRRADVTRATFYLHYRDVYAVLDEVIADALEVAEQQSPLTDEKRRDELARIARTGDEQALRERYELLPACHRAPMRRSTGRSLKMRVWPGIFWNACMNWKRRRFPASCSSMA